MTRTICGMVALAAFLLGGPAAAAVQAGVSAAVRGQIDLLPGVEKVKRRGLELLALSNTNADHIGIIHQICPAMALFDRVYCSHEIHARKPDPAIYRHVTRERGIEPQRCIFVDDLAENVRAAEALGMRGILATDPARIAAALRALGVLEGS